MSKANKVLIGLLAVQLLLVGYLYLAGQNGGRPAVVLLPGLGADQVRKIVISESEEQQVVLRRDSSGWQVELAPERDYPADEAKVGNFLERLVGLKSTRLVSRTRGSQARLKVSGEQFNRKIELATGAGSRSLYLGTSPTYQSIHVRAGEEDEVYLVRDLALWEIPAEASGWWRSRYLDEDPGQLLEVALVNRQGGFELHREAVTEPWRLAGGEEETDPGKTENLLAGICRISINEVVVDSSWRPVGEPEATLKLRTGNGEVELQVWPGSPENSDHPVKVSGSSFFARAGAYAVEELLNAKAEQLRASEPAAGT